METILVVDDEKNYTLIMATLLTGQGYDVVTAQSAIEALIWSRTATWKWIWS